MDHELRKRGIRMTENGTTLEAADITTILKSLPHRYPFLLVDRVLEVRRRPITSDAAAYGWTYEATTVHGPDASVAPIAAPLASILVADLLP